MQTRIQNLSTCFMILTLLALSGCISSTADPAPEKIVTVAAQETDEPEKTEPMAVPDPALHIIESTPLPSQSEMEKAFEADYRERVTAIILASQSGSLPDYAEVAACNFVYVPDNYWLKYLQDLLFMELGGEEQPGCSLVVFYSYGRGDELTSGTSNLTLTQEV